MSGIIAPPIPGPRTTVEIMIRSGFGVRIDPVTGAPGENHNGIDIALPVGTPIYTISPGKVTKVWLDDPYNGTAARIDHNGHGMPYKSSYVHLSALFVKPGDIVTPAIPFGLSGGLKGTWGAGKSTGPHLHLTLWDGSGNAVDPLPRINWTGFSVRVRNPRNPAEFIAYSPPILT